MGDGTARRSRRVHDGGVFEAIVDRAITDYRLEVTYGERAYLVDDPYRWLPTLGEVDLHLIGEGRHENLWQVLGAHVRTLRHPRRAGDRHVLRRLGAERARRPGRRRLRLLGRPRLPDALARLVRRLGAVHPRRRRRRRVQVPDPRRRRRLARQGRPDGVRDRGAAGDRVGGFTLALRLGRRRLARPSGRRPAWHAAPMSIYEVHLGSWRPGSSYRRAGRRARRLRRRDRLHPRRVPAGRRAPVRRVVGLPGHVVLRADRALRQPRRLPLPRRPAAPGRDRRDRRLGAGALPEGRASRWPASTAPRSTSTPTRAAASSPTGARYVFDFGRSEVRNFLVANALYWLEEFHVDGLRVDAVASMLYLDYSREDGEWTAERLRRPREPRGGRVPAGDERDRLQAGARVWSRSPRSPPSWPGVTRPTHLGGLGFGFKWNMGWMHDTLSYIDHEPVHRQYHHNEMTFSMMYAYTENFVLPLSHDEVVHGKGSLLRKIPGDRWQQLATLRALYALHVGAPGQAAAVHGPGVRPGREWAESRSLDWWLLDAPEHRGVQRLVGDLNRVYRETPALWSAGLRPGGLPLDRRQRRGRQRVLVRCASAGDGSALACVANFAAVPHEGYRLGLPLAGRWDEVLNTDADAYFGSGVGNFGRVQAVGEPWHAQPASAAIRVPPLGASGCATPGNERAACLVSAVSLMYATTQEDVMPAVTADTLTLPRVAAATLGDIERPIKQVSTGPRGFEGEGFPVVRAFAGVLDERPRSVRPHGPDGRGRLRARRTARHVVAPAPRLRDGHVHDRRDVPAPGQPRRRRRDQQRRDAVDDRRQPASCTSRRRPRTWCCPAGCSTACSCG